MKLFSKAIIAAAMVLGSASGALADITWTLNDVTFGPIIWPNTSPTPNGDAVTGWFTTDNAVTTITGFSLDVTGPDAFTVAGVASSYLPGEIGIFAAGWSQFIDLYLSSPLTSAGGNVEISSGYDCNNGPCYLTVVSSDTNVIAQVASTPEPSAYPVLACGAILLGLALRRRLVLVRAS